MTASPITPADLLKLAESIDRTPSGDRRIIGLFYSAMIDAHAIALRSAASQLTAADSRAAATARLVAAAHSVCSAWPKGKTFCEDGTSLWQLHEALAALDILDAGGGATV